MARKYAPSHCLVIVYCILHNHQHDIEETCFECCATYGYSLRTFIESLESTIT